MTVRVTWQDANYLWTTSAAFSILRPDFTTVANWLLLTGDKGHKRTRSAGGKQLLLNPADHSVKYFWSMMPALWQSPSKEGDKCAKSGRMDYLSWWIPWWLQTGRKSSGSGSGSLSLHQAAQALLPTQCSVVTQPLPWAGLTHSLCSTHLATLTIKCYPRWKRSRNISWRIQVGLVCRSDRQEQRLILVNAWFFSTLFTNLSLSVSYSTSDSELEGKLNTGQISLRRI